MVFKCAFTSICATDMRFALSFFKVSTTCLRTAKGLPRLPLCAGLPKPFLVAYVISTRFSYAGSYLFFIWFSKIKSLFINKHIKLLTTKEQIQLTKNCNCQFAWNFKSHSFLEKKKDKYFKMASAECFPNLLRVKRKDGLQPENNVPYDICTGSDCEDVNEDLGLQGSNVKLHVFTYGPIITKTCLFQIYWKFHLQKLKIFI